MQLPSFRCLSLRQKHACVRYAPHPPSTHRKHSKRWKSKKMTTVLQLPLFQKFRSNLRERVRAHLTISAGELVPMPFNVLPIPKFYCSHPEQLCVCVCVLQVVVCLSIALPGIRSRPWLSHSYFALCVRLVCFLFPGVFRLKYASVQRAKQQKQTFPEFLHYIGMVNSERVRRKSRHICFHRL